jgi:hypothetical protein
MDYPHTVDEHQASNHLPDLGLGQHLIWLATE